jgi:arsenite/tail-anchored protein-transporting ATPase
LLTGKGGVGKTTLAAATAIAAARGGARTLLVSTDAAHSVCDVLDLPLGAEPVAVAPNLDAVQLDGRHELQRSWSAIADYLHRALGWAEIHRLQVDELMVVPGLDQLVALARLRALVLDGSWDALVVDCAPSADSLRLLMLPDVLGWYIDRLFGETGVTGAWMRRRVAKTLAIPTPDDQVLDSIQEITRELSGLRAMLGEAVTTARVVVTPERLVIAEAQRTMAYLALYGYQIDAVLVNRVAGDEFNAPQLERWLAMERAQLECIDRNFDPLPRLRARRRFAEPIGLEMLEEVGDELYAGLDPVARLSDQPALELATHGAESHVRLFAPGLMRDEIALERDGAELIVTLGEHRRAVQLPDTMQYQDVLRAGRDGAYLEVVFGERARA